ncbi:DUF368 domain-containing protein [Candidatus Protochlamydia amoebophila]|nr:DUF368 domain-containing protein [Candidatus Protochlamydia amoebophila]
MPFKGVYLFFCGLCMGMADLIPGISGGTIAFIMGFYQALLESLKSFNTDTLKLLFTFQWSQFLKKTQWKFLLTLVSGIACSMIFFSSFLHWILLNETYRIYLYSLFLGLILASFVFCIRQVKKWSWLKVIALIIGLSLAYFLTDFTLSNSREGKYAVRVDLGSFPVELVNYDGKLLKNLSASDLSVLTAKKNITPTSLVFDRQGQVLGESRQFAKVHHVGFFDGWLIICGAIAVCALLLPGVSGSYLLMLLGVYPLIIASLADLVTGLKYLHIDQEAVLVLFNLLLGIVIGGFCFARIASALLKNYPDISIAVLSGFMIGALRSVWPFWTYKYLLAPLKLHKGPQLFIETPYFPSLSSFILIKSIVCIAIGFGVVLFVEYLSTFSTKA